MLKKTITLALLTSFSFSKAQNWIPKDKIQVETPKENDKFGVSISLNSSFKFIGASMDDQSTVGIEDESNSNGGAVYVYDLNNNLIQKITPSNPTKSAYFGNNISSSEEILAIGAYYGKQNSNTDIKEGLTYLYQYNSDSGLWEEFKIIEHSEAQNRDMFGRSVSINADNLLVTAHGVDQNTIDTSTGAAYIFSKNNGGDNNWGQAIKLTPLEPQKSAYFGWSGDLHGDYALVGAYFHDDQDRSNVGAAYLFNKNNGGDNQWGQEKFIVPENAMAGDKFGYDVSIGENYMLVSAPYTDIDGVQDAGKVYIYEKLNQEWTFLKELSIPQTDAKSYFGFKVEIHQDNFLISAKGVDSKKGMVYLYTKENNDWIRSEFQGKNTTSNSEFGISLALNTENIIIGSNESTQKKGAFYNFDYQYFSTVDSAISNFFYATNDVGDFDKDGDLDLLISGAIDTTGDFYPDTSATHLYTNNNGVFTRLETPNITHQHLGSVEFIDLNSDGFLDIITTGQNYENITSYSLNTYFYTNGEYVLNQSLDGMIYSSFDFGDYDNDGDLDLLATGGVQAHSDNGNSEASKITKIYNNNNGEFSEVDSNLEAVQNGNAKFGDFDKDGDLDIILMGSNLEEAYVLKVYENENANYTIKQELPGVYLGSLDLGDFDNDGDLDFAIMGDDTDDEWMSKIYQNNNGKFQDYQTLLGVDSSSGDKSLSFGDYDNDGDLDLVISGSDSDYNDVTFLYQNKENSFVLTQNQGLTSLGGNTAINWLDFDNDLDLDLLVSGFIYDENYNYFGQTILHKNHTQNSNQKPNSPNNLTMQNINGDALFTWEAPSDDHTPSDGLHYILTLSSASDNSVSSKIYGTQWLVKDIANYPFSWKVQAVDTSFVPSNYSTQENLSFTNIQLDSRDFNIYPNPVKDYINILNTTNLELKSCSVYNLEMQKVKEFDFSKSNKMPVYDLQKGQYILVFKTKNNSISRKMIKQ